MKFHDKTWTSIHCFRIYCRAKCQNISVFTFALPVIIMTHITRGEFKIQKCLKRSSNAWFTQSRRDYTWLFWVYKPCTQNTQVHCTCIVTVTQCKPGIRQALWVLLYLEPASVCITYLELFLTIFTFVFSVVSMTCHMFVTGSGCLKGLGTQRTFEVSYITVNLQVKNSMPCSTKYSHY